MIWRGREDRTAKKAFCSVSQRRIPDRRYVKRDGSSCFLMELENVRILKEMRNSVNRKVNCETANIHKTVSAAVRQIEDIAIFSRRSVLSSCPRDCRDCKAASEQPEATLKELGMMLSTPVGKSGVNHRLRKLSDIAETLRDNEEENYYD